MLFDLRSRGRRRTVQIIYIGLAVLIGAGLILFGVGTGSGGGGLFGAFTGGNSTQSSDPAVTGQVKQALKQTKQDPSSAAAWSNLVNARQTAANSVGFDSNTNTYTPAGKQQLQGVLDAYGHYTKLVSKPNVNMVLIAARAYTQLGNYKQASGTYQTVISDSPSNIHGLECVTLTSYAAGNTRVAQLAQARVLAKLPKSARATTKATLEQAKTSKTVVNESC